MSDPPFRRLDRYDIQTELGQGAMGIVWRALDTQLDRLVAIKAVRDDLGLPPTQYAELRQRFYHEASAAGRLNHPNIVAVYDVREIDGTPYMVTEFVEGRTLEELLRAEAPLPPKRAIELIAQVCDALEYANRHGVVHRDVKPGNILVSYEGQVKVADFGIARIAGRKMTQTGVKLGTPSYMSPEQARGRPVDGRTDVFSVGVILYEAVTGADAFPGEDTDSVLYQIVHEPVVPLRERRVEAPRGLQGVINRALAKDPDARYPSAGALAVALWQVLAGADPEGSTGVQASSPVQSAVRIAQRPAVLAAVAGGVVLLAGAGVWLGTRESSPPPGVSRIERNEPTAPARPEPLKEPNTGPPSQGIRPQPSDSGPGGRPWSPGHSEAPVPPSPAPGADSGGTSRPWAESAPARPERPPVSTQRPPPVAERPPASAPQPPAIAERPPVSPPQPPAIAERPPVSPERSLTSFSPEDARRRIRALMGENGLLQIQVEVNASMHVDLRGHVPDEVSRKTAERLAQGVPGVRSVTVSLLVAPMDPDLRRTAPAPRDSTSGYVSDIRGQIVALFSGREALRQITVAVDSAANVRLGGTALDAGAVHEAEQLAKSVPGVRSVSNNIRSRSN